MSRQTADGNMRGPSWPTRVYRQGYSNEKAESTSRLRPRENGINSFFVHSAVEE
jgi:hypothetical protein